MTGPKTGFITCPVCNNKMFFAHIDSFHEWCQPFLDFPRLVLTRHEIVLEHLHCNNCNTRIPELVLEPTDDYQVEIGLA